MKTEGMVEGEKYIDNQITWLKAYTDAEIKSVREAVDKVEKTNNAKFDAQNEWRMQFKDQTANFVTRRELWAGIISIITLLIAIAAIIISKK